MQSWSIAEKRGDCGAERIAGSLLPNSRFAYRVIELTFELSRSFFRTICLVDTDSRARESDHRFLTVFVPTDNAVLSSLVFQRRQTAERKGGTSSNRYSIKNCGESFSVVEESIKVISWLPPFGCDGYLKNFSFRI